MDCTQGSPRQPSSRFTLYVAYTTWHVAESFYRIKKIKECTYYNANFSGKEFNGYGYTKPDIVTKCFITGHGDMEGTVA